LGGAWLGGVIRGGQVGEEGMAEKARRLQGLCARLLRVLGVKLASTGTPPAEGALIVANHLSYLDVLVLGALAPTVFVAKKEVSGWPVFGGLARRAGTLFIDRGRVRDAARVGAEMAEALRAGVNVAVFLEGTSTDGGGVGRFKSALLEPAIAAGWPLVPAGLDYTAAAGVSVAKEIAWWGDMELGPHLANLTTVPWVRAHVAWGCARGAAGERKALAGELREAVLALRRPRGEG
jgi:1-acyl-sn-glycerol-3-phosphate acyltransferase